ncbi:MAG: neutral zinc metallopeptidase, partial [Boseongicola sp.]|nr:neutral zinc metallopeptidase [Boseongicola sp.]
MKWRGRRGSSNIEDRRRMSGGRGGQIGIVGVLLILGIGYFFGVDVTPLLQGGGGTQQVGSAELTEADERAGQFVSVTLADTEEVWADIFRQQIGRAYNPATLVLYKGVTQSPCGGAS